MSYYVRYNYR